MTAVSSLKIANQLFQAGKLNEARKEYQKLIEQNPNFSWNYYYLGQLFVKENKWSDAIAQYRQAIWLNPNSANFHNGLAETLIKKGELDEAINYSKKAISLQPYSAIYYQALASAYEAKSDLSQALTTWQKVLSLNPSYLRATQEISRLQIDVARDGVESGNKLNKEGKIKEAVEFYQQALILNPQQPMPVYRTCGNNLITLGRLEEAESVFEQLIKVYPELPQGYEGYARSTHYLPDWELALKRWEEAIAQFPDHIGFQVSKGNVLIHLSRFDEAEAVFQQLKEKYPNQPQGYDGYARVAQSWADWELALKRWSEAIAKFPDNIGFRVHKGNVLINLSRFDEAEEVFQELKEKHSNQPQGYDGYARVAHGLVNWQLALERWEEAIVKFPDHIGFQVSKGNVLINLTRFYEAEKVFIELKEKYPNQPHGYGGYARVAQSLRDWELALERWNHAINAISQLPNHLNFLVQKGNVLIKLSRFDEAEAVFQEIIQKYPRHCHGYDGYGRVANTLPDWELALERWEDAIAKLPHYFNFYLQKGDVLANLFRYEEAETWWEKVIAQYPYSHQGLSKSAALARRLGNREFAWQRFEEMVEKFPWHLPAYCEAAKELIAMGRFAEAEEKFREALQRNPNHLTVLLQSGILASQQGSRELALERFEQAIEFYHPLKAIDAYILAATELKYLGRESEAGAKYEQILSFHQQRGLYPEVKLLGTPLTSIQELGLLLDRLSKKRPDIFTFEHVVSLARLTDKILFGRMRYPASLAKDAPSLLPQFKILKELFWQYLVAQEDFHQRDLLVLKHFNMAIQLLKKESQRLNNNKCGRVKLNHSEIVIRSTDKLCFEGFSSSASYVIGKNEPVAKSQRQAVVKYLPELMDEEKKYFEISIRKLASSLKLRSRQTIEIFKDFIFEPPFGISEGHILGWNYYMYRVSNEFINELDRDTDGRSTTNIVDVANKIDHYIDSRGFLEEIASNKKVLDNYYEDNLIFGLPVAGHIWGAYQNYGHLLFDQIPSLILYQKLNLSCKIFVPHITDAHWEIFGHLNIPKEKILVKQEQKFKYFMIGRYQRDVEIINFYRNLRESIVAKRGDIPSEYRARYVYISRRYSDRRPMVNEVEVEELMASLGFSIVYGERLSFEEKAMLMPHASVVVSAIGTGLLNTIMCHKTTSIVVMFPPGRCIEPYVSHLCVLAEFNLYQLLGYKTANGWAIDIDKLRTVILAILEDTQK